MSTKAMAHDLRCTFTSASKKVSAQDSRRTLPATAQCKFLGLQYIELDQIAGDSVKKDEGKSRFNLWDILFHDRGRETYRGLEGGDMTPVVAAWFRLPLHFAPCSA